MCKFSAKLLFSRCLAHDYFPHKNKTVETTDLCALCASFQASFDNRYSFLRTLKNEVKMKMYIFFFKYILKVVFSVLNVSGDLAFPPLISLGLQVCLG